MEGGCIDSCRDAGVTCRHGILGWRSRERRVVATKVARPRGKKEEKSAESPEIGIPVGSKARNEMRRAPANAAERVVPVRAF